MLVVLAVVVAALTSVATCAMRPNIVVVAVDDLGYDDLGVANGGLTDTPNINALAQAGIQLTHHYAFTLCSPSRASLLSGRYNWGIGWYNMFAGTQDMDNSRCAAKSYDLLPKLLKNASYATHAIGKWDVGVISRNCTPTFTGFDSFLGYYEASLGSYWKYSKSVCGTRCRDLSFNHGHTVVPLKNDTYSTRLFTDRAVDVIMTHNKSAPLFLYLAYQAVHIAEGTNPGGRQAPCETVMQAKYNRSADDSTRVMAAMLEELDTGVGRVVAALKAQHMWDNTIVVLMSDNGGMLGPSANAPFRGGKWGFWEGGLRVVSLASGGVIPASRRNTTYDGLFHISDWYPTLVAGAAGASLGPQSSPRPVDGINLWPTLVSPAPIKSARECVIFEVQNQWYNASAAAIRCGSLKLIVGEPGDNRNMAWPSDSPVSTPFGSSGGVTHGAHCFAPTRDKRQDQGVRCDPYCLFDVVADPGETSDLREHARYAPQVHAMQAKLAYASASAQPPYYIGGRRPHDAPFPALWAGLCANVNRTGFVQPGDWRQL